MVRVFRLPMFVIAAALLGLIALLATLQYRWLGQISGAERERMTATLNTRATAFAQDADRELTRAYLLFQIDASRLDEHSASDVASRYDRWQATARFPRMIKDVYLGASDRAGDPLPLRRFDPSTRVLEPASWPPALAPVHAQIPFAAFAPAPPPTPPQALSAAVLYRASVPSVWPDIPAIVIPAP